MIVVPIFLAGILISGGGTAAFVVLRLLDDHCPALTRRQPPFYLSRLCDKLLLLATLGGILAGISALILWITTMLPGVGEILP